MSVHRIAVIGASLAGLRSAEALRQQGFVGELVLVGDEQHMPYDRPPLSKQVLTGAWQPEQTYFRKKEGYQALALDMRLGVRATGLDLENRSVTLSDGTSVSYDGLIIATGARVRVLPNMRELAGLHALRGLDDVRALRADLALSKRVVIVGAGFIGLEVAASCRALGLEVSVVEALPLPLASILGPTVGAWIADFHRRHGVVLRTGVTVTAIEGRARVERVMLSDGSELPADVVVVGIGVVPNTDWLIGSGLSLDNGVVCDEYCRAAPAVYAAGDVARWYNPWCDERMRVEHWTHAVEQAHAAATNLLAADASQRAFSSVPYFWSDQYDRKIQFAGRCRPDDELRVVSGSIDDLKWTALYGRAGRLTGVVSVSQPRQLIHYRRLLADHTSWQDAVSSPA
jgi:3-phenylpropionate/trans-cinnamate dioxygenase ferredoxin reductase subunit